MSFSTAHFFDVWLVGPGDILLHEVGRTGHAVLEGFVSLYVFSQFRESFEVLISVFEEDRVVPLVVVFHRAERKGFSFLFCEQVEREPVLHMVCFEDSESVLVCPAAGFCHVC